MSKIQIFMKFLNKSLISCYQGVGNFRILDKGGKTKKLFICLFVMTLSVFAIAEPTDDESDKTQRQSVQGDLIWSISASVMTATGVISLLNSESGGAAGIVAGIGAGMAISICYYSWKKNFGRGDD